MNDKALEFISTADMPSPTIYAKPKYNITFCRDGKQIGVLDFNGPTMTFEGSLEDSARVFFDWIAQSFAGRLEEERQKEREACAEIADKPTSLPYSGYGEAIRARSNDKVEPPRAAGA